MALFSIYFDEKDEETKNKITSNYKDHIFVYEGYCIINTPANVSAASIAKDLRILDETTKTYSYGIVFKLNTSYAGYANEDIWNWLDKSARP